ncbi:MAG: putative DNA binding domain-containing protein [Acidimicrobiaceae bacterium]|nr:putative DNA binding domain-containing protein [Acidimicrobiaceae bacterium]
MALIPVPAEVVDALRQIDGGQRPSDLESETMEFKSERGGHRTTLSKMAEAAMCLANSRGGTVVVGVEDAVVGPGAVSGTTIDIHEARRYIFDSLTPGLTVTVAEHHHRGKRLLLVGVPTGATVHAVAGKVARRIGRSCLPLAPDQVAALHDERAGRDPSEGRSGRSVDEVDPAALVLARQHLRQLTDQRVRWADLSTPELCKVMGLATDDGELLIAGEQLFCTGSTEAVIYQHRASVGSPVDASERLAKPLVTAFSRTLEHVAARNGWDPLLLRSGQQLQLQWYPDDVVREALANAFVHRRLDMPDPVHVEHFDDSLSVTSIGSLVSGVTVDNILTAASRPRNRLLARAVRSLGLIEELGTGVGRMYRSMLRLGKPPPSYEATADSVRVSLVGGSADIAFARFVAHLDEPLRDDVEALLVLRRLCEASSTSSADMAPLFQRSVDETASSLKRMSERPSPLIEPLHASASTSRVRYRLSNATSTGLASAVVHRRHTRREIAEKVVAYVSEHGRITNADVRNLFNVGTPRASVILRDLVQRDALVRTSDSSRGPAVEYGPGLFFEALVRRFEL